MPLDVKTLIACNAAIAFFMAAAFLFYRVNYKTYPGYGRWLSSFFILTVVYLSILLRGLLPVWLVIALTNSAGVLVGVLRLDGVMRFTRSHKLKKIYYCLPAVTATIVLFFYFIEDNIVLRNMISSAFITVLAISISLEFYRNIKRENKKLYFGIALINGIYGLSLFTRGIVWFCCPHLNLFMNGFVHQSYFFVTIVMEVGLGFAWLMICNQRLDSELRSSRDNLQLTNGKLEKALSEVKSLSGIVPICMHCKNIRDDEGYWSLLEKYISEHSEAEFSHGICPKCMEERYDFK